MQSLRKQRLGALCLAQHLLAQDAIDFCFIGGALTLKPGQDIPIEPNGDGALHRSVMLTAHCGCPVRLWGRGEFVLVADTSLDLVEPSDLGWSQ